MKFKNQRHIFSSKLPRKLKKREKKRLANDPFHNQVWLKMTDEEKTNLMCLSMMGTLEGNVLLRGMQAFLDERAFRMQMMEKYAPRLAYGVKMARAIWEEQNKPI